MPGCFDHRGGGEGSDSSESVREAIKTSDASKLKKMKESFLTYKLRDDLSNPLLAD